MIPYPQDLYAACSMASPRVAPPGCIRVGNLSAGFQPCCMVKRVTELTGERRRMYGALAFLWLLTTGKVLKSWNHQKQVTHSI